MLFIQTQHIRKRYYETLKTSVINSPNKFYLFYLDRFNIKRAIEVSNQNLFVGHPVWLLNLLISARLEPVLSQTDKSCIALYYSNK